MQLISSPIQRDRPLKITVIHPFQSDWRWYARWFDPKDYDWNFVGDYVAHKSGLRFLQVGFMEALRAKDTDLLISVDALVTVGAGIGRCLRRQRIPHIGYNFFLDGRPRAIRTLKRLFPAFLSRTDLMVVSTQYERCSYGERFGIPAEKLRFQHWAADIVKEAIPAVGSPYNDLHPYISVLGQTNRDFELALKAAADLPVNVVVVCGEKLAPSIPRGPKVHVFPRVSHSEYMQIMNSAAINVIPLKDPSITGGHTTIIMGMQMGVPQIVTETPSFAEYLYDGKHGHTYRPGDVDHLRQQLQAMLEDPERSRRMALDAKEFAADWMSEKAGAEGLAEILHTWENGQLVAGNSHRWTTESTRLAAAEDGVAHLS